MEHDTTERIVEQLDPVIRRMNARLQGDLSERDRLAVSVAITEAAGVGVRVTWAMVAANAAEAGVDISAFDPTRISVEVTWPYPE